MSQIARAYQCAPRSTWCRLIEEHLSLARRIAWRFGERTGLRDSFDDLLQAAFVGLVEAATHYDPQRQCEFSAYAHRRIEGAIVDQLRSMDWRPRRVSRNAREISRVICLLQQKQGRTPREAEVAAALGMGLMQYRCCLNDIESGSLLSLDAVLPDVACDSDPGHLADLIERRQRLCELLRYLTERERQVLYLFYVNDLNQAEIAAALSVSPARVCQLHKQALIRLRALSGNIPC